MAENITQNDAFWVGHDADLALVAGLSEYLSYVDTAPPDEEPSDVDLGPNGNPAIHESDVSWFLDDYAGEIDEPMVE